MFYKSTRGEGKNVKASEAIIRGIAEDGGLYVPEELPKIDKSFKELENMDYKELAFYIMKKYFDDFNEEELKECIDRAYDSKFEDPLIAPLNYKAGAYFLELYHGKTLAFKDMALSILPHLLKASAKKINITKDIVILTATSGDTGKAALEGFDSVEGTKIVVFYPKDGVSEIQKRQMVTQEGKNTFVVGIEGNFDDAQSGVKEIFNDRDFNELLGEDGYMFSSANSINIGRLIPQIVYYVYSYVNLLKDKKVEEGDSINIVVPTGNFGNILAAFYAKNMGIPVGKLICASNKNKVLTDFINTGIYDRRRNFSVTNSPSMDILISSNLERFLYEISGRDSCLIENLMAELKEKGKYEITEEMKKRLNILYGDFADEDDTLKAIEKVYENSDYLIDTHTAVAYRVYEKYKNKTRDNRVTIIASTASPSKFPKSINEVLNIGHKNASDFELINLFSDKLNLKLPKGLEGLEEKEICHKVTCKKDEMKKVIKNFLGI
ncbi:threonine synthase [Clostridium botulinum]|uniref:threonine synthase n=1 Tax=Clostridium botulinum TaxID=1491 RepID=UPI0007E11E29|nr:threonine synthase [Clostridium botulinum]KEI87008.1 threonine synthase [Clostridium botulinum B2 267]MBY6997217.1 threonine synthase [Clostridium botulinum]MBY7010927.1 threonine synthase [Clostridium botulinum]MCR1153842.1 threonine synthase [Clostridium botulinum]MCS6165469.1 threonine synthase [Clostridium botulinum]